MFPKADKKQTKQSAYDIKQKVLISVGEGNGGWWCLQGRINQNKAVNQRKKLLPTVILFYQTNRATPPCNPSGRCQTTRFDANVT